MPVEEVEHPVERHHRANLGINVLEAGLELGPVGGEADHRREVPAGRTAGHDDIPGIAAVFGDVLSHPFQRQFAVDEVVGPRRLGGEPIVDRDADPAPIGEVIHERPALLFLAADHPAAAVDLEEHGRRRPDIVAAPDVEAVPAQPVVDVLQVTRPELQPPEVQDGEHARPLDTGALRRPGRVDRVAPPGSESLGECLLERVVGPAGSDEPGDEAGPG